MSQGQFRAAPYAFVFDGQSLNFVPIGGPTYPTVVMAGLAVALGYESPHVVVAQSGQSWTLLLNGSTPPPDAALGWVRPASVRLYPKANMGLTTFLLMCGGTSDVEEGDTGATIYADMVTYADLARAAGFDRIVAQTITPSTTFSAGEETARAAANVLILADADDAFDAVADCAADPLDDPADTLYYSDGTHWTALGASTAAALTLTAVESLL